MIQIGQDQPRTNYAYDAHQVLGPSLAGVFFVLMLAEGDGAAKEVSLGPTSNAAVAERFRLPLAATLASVSAWVLTALYPAPGGGIPGLAASQTFAHLLTLVVLARAVWRTAPAR
jgi:hypothetical protein